MTILIIILGMLGAWYFGWQTGWIKGFDDGRRFANLKEQGE